MAEKVIALMRRDKEPPPELLDATVLADEPEPDHEWVIPDFIERQGRILLAGPEKCGKSLLALTLAVQAASGITALDFFPIESTPRVLYMDLEMARSSTRRRLRQLIISAKGHLKPGALEILHRPDGFDVTTDARHFSTALGHIRPDLIVIDPLYKLMVTDSVYERDVRPTLKWLDQLRKAFGCSIILVHHLRKRPQGESGRGRDASDIFGSSVLLRWPETLMLLDEDSLRVKGDRDATFGELNYFSVKRGGVWPIGLTSGGLDGDIEAEILDYLQVGPTSGNELAKNVHHKRQKVGRMLQSLEHRKLIVRQGQGYKLP
jgi:hypothetical protein